MWKADARLAVREGVSEEVANRDSFETQNWSARNQISRYQQFIVLFFIYNIVILSWAL